MQHLVVIHAAFGFYEYMYLVEPWRITWRSSSFFFVKHIDMFNSLDILRKSFLLLLPFDSICRDDNDFILPQ